MRIQDWPDAPISGSAPDPRPAAIITIPTATSAATTLDVLAWATVGSEPGRLPNHAVVISFRHNGGVLVVTVLMTILRSSPLTQPLLGW